MTAPFAPEEDRAELAATVRALLAKHADARSLRPATTSAGAYDEEVWSMLAEQVGAAGLAVPEEHGGAGYTLAETHVVLEELGATLTPTPLLGSGVLAVHALLLGAEASACEEMLPGLADGSRVGALCWADRVGWHADAVPVTAHEDHDGWTLTGATSYVLDGGAADLLLVAGATAEGIALFAVDPAAAGVRREAVPTMDQTLRLARVAFEGSPARLLGRRAGWLPRLGDVAATAVTALQVGAMQRCLEMTVDYSRQRVQFGRPIGSFQALKHRMADMLVDVETSRSISRAAVEAVATGSEDASRLAATAKTWCSEALTRVAAETVQMHGGIAITWEHDAHLYFKRAHALSQLFGQPHEHIAAVAAASL